MICGALCIVQEKLQGLVVVARSGKNLCSNSFFDFRMTIKCARCSWCHGFHLISHCHRVLNVMNLCLINYAVYQEGSRHLITRVCSIQCESIFHRRHGEQKSCLPSVEMCMVLDSKNPGVSTPLFILTLTVHCKTAMDHKFPNHAGS